MGGAASSKSSSRRAGEGGLSGKQHKMAPVWEGRTDMEERLGQCGGAAGGSGAQADGSLCRSACRRCNDRCSPRP